MTSRQRPVWRDVLALVVAPATIALLAALAACTGEEPALTSGNEAGAVLPDGAALDAAADAGGRAICNGIEVDTASSGEHCGACDRDCAGGECSHGVCQPATLVDGLSQPVAVAIGGSAAIWLDERGDAGVLESCPLAGCGSARKEIRGAIARRREPAPRGPTLVSDGLDVHWIAGASAGAENAVFGCNLALCHPDEVTAPAVQLARSDRALLYRTTSGGVHQCGFGACASGAPSVVGGGDGALGFAVHMGRLVHAVRVPGGIDKVFTCALSTSGCADSRTLFSLEDVAFLAGGIDTIFAVAGSTLLSCAAAGCGDAPASLATDLFDVSALLTTDDTLYVALAGAPGTRTGEIRACALPRCEGGPRRIATGLPSPRSMAFASGLLVWANAGDAPGSGSVQKLRR